MQQVGPKGEGQGEGKWGVARGLHPCPGSFALCASSPPCVWVISNLLGEPVYISTYLHACTQAQPRLSSNLVFLKQMFSFFKTPVPHSTVGRIPRAVREAESWRWSGVDQRGWTEVAGDNGARGAHQSPPSLAQCATPGHRTIVKTSKPPPKEQLCSACPGLVGGGWGGTGGTRRKLPEGGS